MSGKKRCKRNTAWIVLTVLILSGAIFMPISVFAENDEAADILPGGRIVVSMGDSYSSGEGLGNYGKAENAEKPEDQDWLAHRSDNAWPAQLSVPGIGTLGEHRDASWYFVAASGADTRHFTAGQIKYFLQADGGAVPLEDDISFSITSDLGGGVGTRVLDKQLAVFSKIPEGTTAYVTLTIGGNDLGFEDILITTAVTPSVYFPNVLPELLKDAWDRFENGTDGQPSIREKIKQVYRDVAAAAGENAVIIVAGYPELLDESVNSALFDSNEAELINRYVRKLDEALADLVEEYRSENEGARIRYVSVIDAFKDHQAYSADPYINGIIFEENDEILDYSPISAASFHPNEKGAAAYRDLVQAAIDECEIEYTFRPENETAGGRLDEETAYQALNAYADENYGPDETRRTLVYDPVMDVYLCKIEINDSWRWVTLRAYDGKIFDRNRNLFSYSGNAADYLQDADNAEEAYPALPAEMPGGDGINGGSYGVSRYDIDGDGEAETLLFIPCDESTASVFIYYTWKDKLVPAGRMIVPAASAGGLYIYNGGIITSDARTGSLRYFVLKYHCLTEKKNWEGSGLKTEFDYAYFYSIHYGEIKITPRFREYKAV